MYFAGSLLILSFCIFTLIVLSFTLSESRYDSIVLGTAGSFLASILFLCVIYIFSFYVHRKIESRRRLKFIRDIREAIGLDKFDYIKQIYFQIYDVKWKEILEGKTEATVSMAFAGRNFIKNHGDAFIEFAKRGGILRIYIASPDQYRSISRMIDKQNDYDQQKVIIESYINLSRHFRLWDSIYVYYSSSGANFMSASTEGGMPDSLIFSPYAATLNKPPTLEFDAVRAPAEMRNFILSELRVTRERAVDMSLGDHVRWSESQEAFYVSSSLSCVVGCPYCYIGSVKDGGKPKTAVTAELAFSAIAADPNFSKGKSTVFLGGFNDPFGSEHDSSFSVSFIKLFSLFGYDNPIHIATKYPVAAELTKLTTRERGNVVVNSSMSSSDPRSYGESTDIDERFSDLADLAILGINTTLFVRPVIPDLTIHHKEKLANLCLNNNVKYVTLGGLYQDKRIIRNLKKHGLNIGTVIDETRIHPLDKSRAMKKLKNDKEYEEIANYFRSMGLHVFENSAARVAHFRRPTS